MILILHIVESIPVSVWFSIGILWTGGLYFLTNYGPEGRIKIKKEEK